MEVTSQSNFLNSFWDSVPESLCNPKILIVGGLVATVAAIFFVCCGSSKKNHVDVTKGNLPPWVTEVARSIASKKINIYLRSMVTNQEYATCLVSGDDKISVLDRTIAKFWPQSGGAEFHYMHDKKRLEKESTFAQARITQDTTLRVYSTVYSR